ncbi:PIN domain-containing protein [Candidatus Pacearchaeota archaeon]|nr:PIN domain-containing protein [Candidatus Pacearchaeota archaeon]
MEELKHFFLDTYAMYELVHNSENYKKYQQGISIVTSKLNLMELHYGLLRTEGKDSAEYYYDFFLEFCVEFDDAVIKEANEFRLKNYRRDLSYVDCIGYILARKLNAKFLTGDKQFENFEGVEFVK